MKVRCTICPRLCEIAEGECGECRVRFNIKGELRALNYGHPCALHVDPVEKKPLYHFLPGSPILSVATVGCNLHCKNCQNWEISQAALEEAPAYEAAPESLVEAAMKKGCPSIAYTYTDPTIYYEYARDTCILAHEKGIKNVLVTAGYINPGPMRELYQHVDAANIDLKAMSDSFYREVCDGRLAPVLRTLETARALGVHVEVTNLVIPTLNDSDKALNDLAQWVADHLGGETPLHFSRFFPQHRMRDLPPTPPETLLRARRIAQAAGLKHVYIGNWATEEAGNTRCAGCHGLLIEREGYHILQNRLREGACPACGAAAHGVWA